MLCTQCQESSFAHSLTPQHHNTMHPLQKLKSLITLSETSIDLFSQPPLPAHDLYLREIRAGSIRQTQCQTNDDARSMPTQTEHIDMIDM